MNLKYKVSQEELDEISKKQPVKIKKGGKWNNFWVKFGKFIIKGLITHKWEIKIKF